MFFVILKLSIDCLLILLASSLKIPFCLFLVLLLCKLCIPGCLLFLEVCSIGLYGTRYPGASVDSATFKGQHPFSMHSLAVYAISGIFFAEILVRED